MDYDKDFEDGFEYTSMGALHYMYHSGTKQKIIFLHGLGSSTKAWAKLMPFVPDDFDIFLIDLLGHGKSDAPEMEYSISNQFQALREFMAMRNNGDSYIFGHSYGGWVAAYYASQPYTCKGIILEDSAGLKEYFDPIVHSGKMGEYKQNMLKMVLAWNPNKEQVFSSILDCDFKEDQLDSAALSKITARTKIIWGRNDELGDKSLAQVFLSGIKGSTLDIIEGAGHEPHYTNPETVGKILIDFIKQAP